MIFAKMTHHRAHLDLFSCACGSVRVLIYVYPRTFGTLTEMKSFCVQVDLFGACGRVHAILNVFG